MIQALGIENCWHHKNKELHYYMVGKALLKGLNLSLIKILGLDANIQK